MGKLDLSGPDNMQRTLPVQRVPKGGGDGTYGRAIGLDSDARLQTHLSSSSPGFVAVVCAPPHPL